MSKEPATSAAMEPSVLRFVLRHSMREQIALLVMTISAFPFLYLSLDLPKIIINEAIAGADFPQQILGQELEQIPYLLSLCIVFLCLVLLNGGFKYVINVYRGVVGERMLRRLRFQLIDRVMREVPIQADFVGRQLPTNADEHVMVHLKELDDKDEVLLAREK